MLYSSDNKNFCGYVEIKDGCVSAIGHKLGREGGFYWRASWVHENKGWKAMKDELREEVIRLTDEWGIEFYSLILEHATSDAQLLPDREKMKDLVRRKRVIRLQNTRNDLEEGIKDLKMKCKDVEIRMDKLLTGSVHIGGWRYDD